MKAKKPAIQKMLDRAVWYFDHDGKVRFYTNEKKTNSISIPKWVTDRIRQQGEIAFKLSLMDLLKP